MYVEKVPPKVWQKLGNSLYQGCCDSSADFYCAIDDFWLSLSNAEKSELKGFMHHVLSDELPGGMKKKSWHLSGADLVPNKVEPFLSDILSRFKG
jgi:hypothetical protein